MTSCNPAAESIETGTITLPNIERPTLLPRTGKTMPPYRTPCQLVTSVGYVTLSCVARLSDTNNSPLFSNASFQASFDLRWASIQKVPIDSSQ
jgi:hypothetical protein